jgi:hypothetical protein
VLELPERLHRIHETQAKCQILLETAQKKYKKYADRRRDNTEFEVGDKVWLEGKNLSTDAPSKKLGAKRFGPYEILDRISPTAYKLNIPLNWRIHNVFHVSLISKTKEDTVLGRNPAPQPVVKLTDQELWVIDKFVNSRWFRGKFQLKVHWEDQGEDQDDWRDHETVLREAATWREQLAIEDLPEEDPTIQLREEYYARHPGAPRHDDPPHRRAAPPRTRAVR